MDSVNLLGVRISSVTEDKALEFILSGLEKKGGKLAIFTPNPEIIAFANKHRWFRAILNSSDLGLPDGIGVMWAGKFLGKQLKERITGADFMKRLISVAEEKGFTVGLMGGGPKIAERVAECLWKKFPRLKIVFVASKWPEKDDRRLKMEDHHLPSNIDILFVAFGFPKQEKWIAENLPKIPVRVAMAVGGSFDYISGAVPRAPIFVRTLGLEWLFRLIVQPWRWKRQLALLEFLFLVLKAGFSRKKN